MWAVHKEKGLCPGGQTKGAVPFISRYQAVLLLVFAIGCFVRLVGIGSFVNGINSDEASIGYDAWAIANYGMDRNLVSMPAYLIAWGSGQNAGYAYLLIPFIKLFGLNLFTLRLPMALVGCVSMWALYTILRRHKSKHLALLGVFLLAICPWHILKSRWALEANLLPDLLLWGVALLCAGIASGKARWYYWGFFTFGLCAWAYATSFVVLPLFLLPSAYVLWRRRQLALWQLALCFGILLLVAWPIVLFSLANMLGWPSIYTPFFTIPQMLGTRTAEFALFGENPIKNIYNNAKTLLTLLLSQDDNHSWNSVLGFGLIYQFSLPLAIAGGLRAILPAQKGGCMRAVVPGSWLFVPLGFVAVFLGLMLQVNINRINALWMPLIWFWVLGAYEIVCLGAFWRRLLVGMYAVFFLLFCNTAYKDQTNRFNSAFDAGFLEAVRYVDTFDKPVYISGASPVYIKILFEIRPSPQQFRDSVRDESVGAYGDVYEFDKWMRREPENYELSHNYVIVVRDGRQDGYLEAGWQMQRFDYFWVGWAP